MSPTATDPGTTSRPVPIRRREFERLAAFIHEYCGIKITQSKTSMLEARLQKRLRDLGMHSFDEYCDHVLGPEAPHDELVRMIDLVTTNKTDFFRESNHLDYLRDVALPEFVAAGDAGLRRPLSVWSAGCSSGEEPYSLAMVLSEFAGTTPGFRFEILATDISTRVLAHAARGVYDEERVEPVPVALRQKYLMRSRNRENPQVRVAPELRSTVTFRRLNFMEADFHIAGPVDVAFCRNVIIYFDKPTQEVILNRIVRHLVPGGYLFMGHSETLFGLAVPVVQVAPTIYRRA